MVEDELRTFLDQSELVNHYQDLVSTVQTFSLIPQIPLPEEVISMLTKPDIPQPEPQELRTM